MATLVKHYKIRHKDTGLFQMGGCCVRWTKKGKVWTGLGHLKAHLSLFRDWRTNEFRAHHDIENWEVVELEVVVTPSNTVGVKTLLGIS